MDNYIHIGNVNGEEYRLQYEDVSEIYGAIRHADDDQEMIDLVKYYGSKDRIAYLKKFLADTDYCVIKIAEGQATKEDYADIIEQREAAREEIRTLEN